MSQKSYNGKNSVYLIPTPIGNLEDITLRSINMLKYVDVIFSEDTRKTRQLLNHLEIQKKLIASHKFNEFENKEKLLKFLNDGLNVGIVTDRGTPIISDPGEIITKYAIEENYNVIALPGATAFVPALIVSGLNAEHFYFFGFLNSKESKAKKELENLKNIKDTLIFYEAPHRIDKTLKILENILGDRKISISREISKKFEEVYRGTISEVKKEIEGAKGEMVIVVDGNKEVIDYNDIPISEHVNMYMISGLDKKESMKKVAKDRCVSKSEIYKIYNRGE